MAVATGCHDALPPLLAAHGISHSVSKVAPPSDIKIEERDMGRSKGAGGREFAIGKPADRVHLGKFEGSCEKFGAAPTWAVTYGSHGAVGFDTALAADDAFKLLASSPIFLGNAITVSWNIDHRSRYSARSCRYGTVCRGCNTFCFLL